MFFNRVEGLTDRLAIIEDQIRLRAAALGETTDSAVERFLSGSQGSSFKFITNENTGEISWILSSMFDEDNPELQEDRYKGTLEKFSEKLKGPLNATVNFSITTQVDVLNTGVIIPAIGILISRTYCLPDKIAQLSQYVIGNPDGPCISLITVLCLNHRNKLSCYI